MKVAIVHEWFVNYAGSEKVVEQLLNLYPDADLYALVDYLKDDERAFIRGKKVTTSFIQRLPFSRKKFRSYLPLMPLAVEQFDLSKYDLVISSSHAVAKGIITHPHQIHVCYCHSPIRYAWDMQHQYLKDSGLDAGLKSIVARVMLHYVRLWDVRTAHGVDSFVANSSFIAKRIWKTYNKKSTVIHPPVNVDDLPYVETKEDFYVTASRLVPYKKIDLIVEAFNQMPHKKLVVIGDGPRMGKIRETARANVELLGYQPDSVLHNYIGRAKGFVFAAEEDFGIAPVEALACGTPVIAYGRGGVLDTVSAASGAGRTGLFFFEQTSESIRDAINEFEELAEGISPASCRLSSMRFSDARFREEMQMLISTLIERHNDQLKGFVTYDPE